MRKELICGIYCIENLVNNKKYIGQSVDIYGRFSKHKSSLNNDSHDNDYLQKSWRKYGEKNFKFYIIELCERNQLDDMENYYIDLYQTTIRDFGYNLKSGGQAHNVVCQEVRQKISNAIRQSYDDDLKQLRKQKALNQWANPEIKAKITGENNGMYGKKHSDEARKKMSEAAKRRCSTKRDRTPVYCIELNRTFEDAVTAAEELGCQSGSILRVCHGKGKTACGYHWQFIQSETQTTKQNNLKE